MTMRSLPETGAPPRDRPLKQEYQGEEGWEINLFKDI